MHRRLIHILRKLLFPFSLIYGVIVETRNLLFNIGVLKSTEFKAPIICVGNITVGGTGKTPHTELLIEMLGSKNNIAVLSRGYGRKSKGFVMASSTSTVSLIGDEPFQIKQKFPKVKLAVCEKRVEGIKELLELHDQPELIVLDDAFQHRWVKPALSIVLVDYKRPIFKDCMLPAGNLREARWQLKRARIVVVSKCPDNLTMADMAYWTKRLKIKTNQSLYFTSFQYEKCMPVFNSTQELDITETSNEVLLVTGIANPAPIEHYLQKNGIVFKLLRFPDHHNFSSKDIQSIIEAYKSLKGADKIIITTEKDAMRLAAFQNELSELEANLYYLPIKVNVLFNKKDELSRELIGKLNLQ